MLSKDDLIYLGAILLWASPALGGNKDDAVEQAKEIYNKIFKEN
jgi:hypothetical protein